MEKKVFDFDLFLEGIKIRDLSSIPGKEPNDPDYLRDVSRRAKQRLGIYGQMEGDPGSIQRAVGPLMTELGRSRSLSRGHEAELEKLATDVIMDLYKPLIDHYNIKLDIKISDGRSIRRMIDDAYAKVKKGEPNTPSQRPVIRARGADFSMLIHEAVKGMWRVLSMVSVPQDRELAKAIESQFELSDEPEDWRYGPELAADLRDFVNENPKVDKFKNVREELWIMMVDEKTMPTEEFLKLMRGIFSKSPEARQKIDQLIDKVIVKLEKRAKYERDLEQYNRDLAEYERKLAEYEAWQKKQGKQSRQPETTEPEEIDYSKMSKKQLDDELSKALDARDFKKAEEISKYLK